SVCVTEMQVALGTSDERDFNYGPCDFNTNLTSSVKDDDHNITTSFTYDKFCNETGTTESGGSFVRNRTVTYLDGQRKITSTRDVVSASDGQNVQNTWYDPLGRVRQTV